MRSIRQQIVSGIITTVLILGAFAFMAAFYGNRAEYRSRAICYTLVKHVSSIDEIHRERLEEKISEDTKIVTFVHRGVIPFSRYRCTVKVKNGVVIEGETSHRWAR